MEQLASTPGSGPHWGLAVVPILVVLGVIILPRVLLLSGAIAPGQGLLGQLLGFSLQQPILWPSLALVFATGIAVMLFAGLWGNTLWPPGQGADDSILPL